MPHFILEYTDNIAEDADVPALLAKVHNVLIAQGGIFPTGGIRSRAIALHEYRVADGAEDDAFVHATLKVLPGRSANVKEKTCDEVFAAMREHFAALFARRYLALSLELVELTDDNRRDNNIHARFTTRDATR